MLKNNVSMSRQFYKYKAVSKAVRKKTSKVTYNSDSEDSIDMILNRMKANIPDNDLQKSYSMIKNVQKRLKEKRIFEDMAKS